MKQAIYLFAFLAIPFLMQAETPPIPNLSGVWQSEFSHHIYKIKELPDGLEVKCHGGNWVFFGRVARHKFMDRHGNTVVVTGNRSLKHRARHGRIVRRLFWAKPLRVVPPPPVCATPVVPHEHYDTHTHYETSDYGYTVEGTWWMQNRDERLYIQRTTDGLRAKSEVLDQWYYYRKIAPNKYVDDRGNEYKIVDEKTVIWTHANGREALVFVK